MNAVHKEVEQLISKELAAANEQFPLFNSVHEAYAVMKEEVMEAVDEMGGVGDNLDDFWKCIRKNESMTFLEHYVQATKASAVRLAVEAIQVAAMCDKFMLSFVTTEPFPGDAHE